MKSLTAGSPLCIFDLRNLLRMPRETPIFMGFARLADLVHLLLHANVAVPFTFMWLRNHNYPASPQRHFLNFLPEPQEQGSLRPILTPEEIGILL